MKQGRPGAGNIVKEKDQNDPSLRQLGPLGMLLEVVL